MKYIYDKATLKSHRKYFCENPCITFKCGRMIYIYPKKSLCAYSRAIRETAEWNHTYKIRAVVEREINHTKENLYLAGRRAQN